MHIYQDLLANHPILLAAGGFTLGSMIVATITNHLGRVLVILTRALVKALFVEKQVHDWSVVDPLMRYLGKGRKISHSQNDYLSIERAWIKSLGKTRQVFMKFFDHSFTTYFHGRWPIFFVPRVDSDGDLLNSPAGSFYSFRWTVNWMEIFKGASDLDDTVSDKIVKTQRQFRIVRYVGTRGKNNNAPGAPSAETTIMLTSGHHTDGRKAPLNFDVEDIGLEVSYDPLGDLSLGEQALKLVKDVKFWVRNREWYEDRGITWRRGYLLHGVPGSGKTSLIRAIAQDQDISVHTFDLPSMNNQDFISSWSNAQGIVPRVVLLEDFDSVFKGRENIAGSELTYDTVLNALDGIERPHGMLLFVTTNHVENLDPALGIPDSTGRSSRPGRIDVTLELPPLDRAGRIKLALRITKDCEAATKLADEFISDSPAQFQERCVQYAKDELWSQSL